MTDIAPGWYKDPAEPTTQRYWDGEGWIGEPLPADAAPPAQPPRAEPVPAPSEPPKPAGGEHATPVPAPGTTPPGTSGRPAAPRPPGTPAVAPPPGTPASASPPGTSASAPPPGSGWRPGMPPPGMPWPPPRTMTAPGQRLPHALVRPLPHGLPLAPLGLRLLARLIDTLAVFGLNVVGNGWLVYLYLSDISPTVNAIYRQMLAGGSSDSVPALPGRANWLITVIPLIAMALWFAYEVPATAQSGQTFGKRLVGIKVMPLESQAPLGFGRALRRWNPLGLPVLLWTCFGVGFVLQLVDAISPVLGGPLQMALHDRSAQTVVVHSGRRGHEITPVQVPEQTGEK